MDDTERERIAAAVKHAMRPFEQAERARDADALIAHFGSIPGFHIYSDGSRLSYEAMSAYIRDVFPTLRAVEGGFVELDIMVGCRRSPGNREIPRSED